MIARLALTAALLGCSVGAAAVLAAPHDDTPAKRRPPAVAAVSSAVPTPEPLPARDVQPLLEVPDPEGGAPWSVRSFTTDTLRCWELGRRRGDQFGWIDGHATFTARAPGRYAVPSLCQRRGERGTPPARFTTIAYPPGRTPQPSRTITWGVVADEVTQLAIDGEPPLAVQPGQPFVHVAAGPARISPLSGAFVRRDGTRERFDYRARRRGDRSVPGTERVVVRAPDPAGGESWGLVTRRDRAGGLCFDSPGRLVGDQAGFVDHRLDTFLSGFDFGFRCGREKPTRGYPLRIDTLISGVTNGEDRGEIERRVLSNRIVFWGRAHPDVVSVTITTPRDVRTLIPTRDHFVLAVYDGQFPGGKATATARLRDGKEVTRSLYVE